MPSWCWNKPRFWRAFVRRPYSFSTAKLELPWCRACDSAKENIISAALQNRHKKQVNKSINSLQTSKQDGLTTNPLLSPPRAYLYLKDCLFNGLNICRFFANSLLRDSQSSSLDVFSPGKGKQKTQQDKSVRRFHGHYLEKLQASTIIDPFFLCSSISMRSIIFGFWSFVSQG